jgi:hypothetical protein
MQQLQSSQVSLNLLPRCDHQRLKHPEVTVFVKVVALKMGETLHFVKDAELE